MRNKHPNLNHYLFFKCDFFFPLVEDSPLLLLIQILYIPEEPDQFPWHLCSSLTMPNPSQFFKAILNSVLDSVHFHYACLFSHE